MTCKTCGFAASDPVVTVCPYCKGGASAGAAALTASLSAGVWPPAPSGAMSSIAQPEYFDAEANKQQRQIGILMDVGGLAVIQAASWIRHLLPEPYGSPLMLVAVLGCVYPHFRGSAHWAESKGYPRRIGRLAGFLSWLGPIALALMPDKSQQVA